MENQYHGTNIGTEDAQPISYSPWASYVVLVKDKNGWTRYCIDYHMENSLTRKDSYTLPQSDDTEDTLVVSEIFSILEEDKEKTIFTLGSKLWQVRVMPLQSSSV